MSALPHNVEKSIYLPKTYRVYDARGQVWHARKARDGWFAQPAVNNPARSLGSTLTAPTLTAIAQTIAARKPVAVVEPF